MSRHTPLIGRIEELGEAAIVTLREASRALAPSGELARIAVQQDSELDSVR
jgi:hypothetical protein